jgi:hypothetical protein
MTLPKIIYIALLIVSCPVFCTAQQSQKYVYEDSAILYDEEETAATVEAPTEDTSYATTAAIIKKPDTILHKNEIFISKDSIALLKNDAAFAYAKTLDSLLHELQKKYAVNADSKGREAAGYGETKEDEWYLKENDTDISWLERLFASPITQFILWSLAGIFVAIILYRLFFADGFLKGQSKKLSPLHNEEKELELSGSADYDALIAKAVAIKNFRLATRYHYLKALQQLSQKEAILLAADKTNFQYLSELTGKPCKQAFASVLLVYEYVWYGEFEMDENKFYQIQKAFKNFDNQL